MSIENFDRASHAMTELRRAIAALHGYDHQRGDTMVELADNLDEQIRELKRSRINWPLKGGNV